MTPTGTQSRDQTARQRARQAMADELEKARKRENKLAEVFTTIDTRNAAQLALGTALTELRDLGIAQADLAELTGLSVREVGAAIKASKANTTQATEQEPTDGGATDTDAHAGEADHGDAEN
ncbi:hypothetical protein [Dietzia kunjamensis]|uniref:hypothetical protein n=1 Tax=Dietzia kunjamensis TaxID=322509 RepID=UPI003366B455